VTGRRIPRWHDVKPLLGGGPPRRTALDAALTIDDLRDLARRRTPRPVFDYTDGGAEDERCMRRAREAFDAVLFHPHVLRDVAKVDTATEILGSHGSIPLVLAPTGFTRMMHTAGEPAVGRAAAAAGVPYTLSTMGTTGPEALRAAAPDADLWFQLYLWQDRDRSLELIERVRASGYRVLVLTVDVPVAGARRRDIRNGLTIPPSLTPKTFASFVAHPRWSLDLLTSEPLSFATFSESPQELMTQINTMFDPRAGWDDLDWLCRTWEGPVVVKGIQRVDDARRAIDLGAQGVVLSNHGGRQLDRAVTPLRLLPEVRAALGTDPAVLLDTGVRSGADVVAAVALGADACMVGRAYLYGLMAGGEAGVARALDIFADDVRRTMQLLGATSIAELAPDLATLP
jgi:L-lactate dehydrogenase (cytochrome)